MGWLLFSVSHNFIWSKIVQLFLQPIKPATNVLYSKKFLIPMSLYIDDRLIEMIRDQKLGNGYQRAAVANYIVCEILLRLGYCINLEKSVFVPTQKPVFLGFIVDSVNRCFRLTNEKKTKFANLRDPCLSGSKIKVLDLQRLAGRCISFLSPIYMVRFVLYDFVL